MTVFTAGAAYAQVSIRSTMRQKPALPPAATPADPVSVSRPDTVEWVLACAAPSPPLAPACALADATAASMDAVELVASRLCADGSNHGHDCVCTVAMPLSDAPADAVNSGRSQCLGRCTCGEPVYCRCCAVQHVMAVKLP